MPTGRGRAVIGDVLSGEHERLRAVADRLDPADVDATLRVLAVMVDSLSEVEPPDPRH